MNNANSTRKGKPAGSTVRWSRIQTTRGRGLPREHASPTPGANSHCQTSWMNIGVKQHFEYPAFLSVCSQSLLWLAPCCLALAVDRLLFDVWAQLHLLQRSRSSSASEQRISGAEEQRKLNEEERRASRVETRGLPHKRARRTPGATHHCQTTRVNNGVKEHVEYPVFLSARSQSLLRLVPIAAHATCPSSARTLTNSLNSVCTLQCQCVRPFNSALLCSALTRLGSALFGACGRPPAVRRVGSTPAARHRPALTESSATAPKVE